MPRFIKLTMILALSGTAAGVSAKPPPKPPEQVLLDGLQAMGTAITGESGTQQASSQPQQASPQAAPKQPDHDQGDDHASDVAILKVCSHDNPSAQRSAICPQPNSPP